MDCALARLCAVRDHCSAGSARREVLPIRNLWLSLCSGPGKPTGAFWWRLAVVIEMTAGELMADNLKERRPQDASRISASEDREMSYWTKDLGVSADELRRLVAQRLTYGQFESRSVQ